MTTQEIMAIVEREFTAENFEKWLKSKDAQEDIGDGSNGIDCPMYHFANSLFTSSTLRVSIGFMDICFWGRSNLNVDGSWQLPEWAVNFNRYVVNFYRIDAAACLILLTKAIEDTNNANR